MPNVVFLTLPSRWLLSGWSHMVFFCAANFLLSVCDSCLPDVNSIPEITSKKLKSSNINEPNFVWVEFSFQSSLARSYHLILDSTCRIVFDFDSMDGFLFNLFHSDTFSRPFYVWLKYLTVASKSRNAW